MILGLDLATNTGACVGDGSKLPVLLHTRLPAPVDGDRGPTFVAFVGWLSEVIETYQPTIVVFEAPIIPRPIMKADARGKVRPVMLTNLTTTTLLQGLAAMVELVCAEKNVSCREVNVRAVKKELAGSTKAKKADMMAAARKVGLAPKTEDEADALAVWLIGVRFYAARYQPEWDKRLYGARGYLL